MFHTATTGSFPAQTVKLRAKKISSSGTINWNTNIQDLGAIAAFTVPKVYSDKSNGCLIAWHDDRDFNSLQSGFVQRVDADGSVYFPVNGAEVSLMPNRHKFNPVVAFDNTTNETYVFWLETEPNPSQNGISGQKLSLNGTRQWTDNAKIFKDLSAPNTASISSLNAEIGNGRAYLFYLEGNAGGLNDKVEGFSCDGSGNFLWPSNFVILSNPISDKLQMVSTVDVYKNCKLAWGDKRLDGQGIYGQDINPDGQLGNSVIPVELVSFEANVSNNNVTLNWITATELNNSGFQIERSSGSEYQVIGFVAGYGTTTETQNYTYSDENLNAGTYTYKLKQIDFDGTFTYSNEIKVDFNLPQAFKLEQNYPNPFNPSTDIHYTIGTKQFVQLKIYDMLGNVVASLVNKEQVPGNYEINFNALALSSGIYFCKLQTDNFTQSIKMILLK